MLACRCIAFSFTYIRHAFGTALNTLFFCIFLMSDSLKFAQSLDNYTSAFRIGEILTRYPLHQLLNGHCDAICALFMMYAWLGFTIMEWRKCERMGYYLVRLLQWNDAMDFFFSFFVNASIICRHFSTFSGINHPCYSNIYHSSIKHQKYFNLPSKIFVRLTLSCLKRVQLTSQLLFNR